MPETVNSPVARIGTSAISAALVVKLVAPISQHPNMPAFFPLIVVCSPEVLPPVAGLVRRPNTVYPQRYVRGKRPHSAPPTEASTRRPDDSRTIIGARPAAGYSDVGTLLAVRNFENSRPCSPRNEPKTFPGSRLNWRAGEAVSDPWPLLSHQPTALAVVIRSRGVCR